MERKKVILADSPRGRSEWREELDNERCLFLLLDMANKFITLNILILSPPSYSTFTPSLDPLSVSFSASLSLILQCVIETEPFRGYNRIYRNGEQGRYGQYGLQVV